MATFTDAAGRTWSLAVSVGTVKRTIESTGVNLTELTSDDLKPFRELISSPLKFADVLYSICKPQCDEKGVGAIDFFDALAGETIVECVEPFAESIADFFLPRQKILFMSLIRKTIQAADALAGRAQQTVDDLDVEALTSSALSSQA